MKFAARLLAVAVFAATLTVAGPALADDGNPLEAWNTALASSDSGQANVVYLGSSTTYGTGASSPEKRYVNVLTDRLRGTTLEPVTRAGSSFPNRNTAAGVHGYVSAAGGTTSENYVNNTTRAFILWEKPSLIVHMIGSNDSVDAEPYAVTAAEYEANVGAEIDRLNAGSTQPVSHLLVHTYRRAGTSLAKWATYRDALERIAATRDNVAVLDISAEYEAADHIGADPRDLIGPDGVHQTDAGHAFMADLLAPALTASPVEPVEVPPTPTPAPVEPTETVIVAPVPVVPTPAPAPAAVPALPVATLTPAEVNPPAAPRRVRAVRDGRRMKVTWRKVAAAESYEVRCGKLVKETTGARVVLRSAARRCAVRSVNSTSASRWVRANR